MGGIFKKALRYVTGAPKKVGKEAKRALSSSTKQFSGLTPEAQKYQSKVFGSVDPKKLYRDLLLSPEKDISAFEKGLGKFIDPSQRQMMKEFQTGVVDPTMQQFQQQVVPGIQERFAGQGLSSSSALNQALAGAASNVSTQMGAQLPQFMQAQRGLQMQGLGMLPGARGQFYSPMMGALGQIGSMSAGQPISNVHQEGLGSSLGGGLAKTGIMAAATHFLPKLFTALSSKDVKENIKDCNKGLKDIENLEVKSYDYKEGFGDKNRIGIIAEDAPEEIRTTIDGVNAVDLYGMISLLVNSVKELSARVKKLEA